MKFLPKILLLATFLSFLIPRTMVRAGDYVSDAVEALKTSNVYVAPGIPGTDYNTPSQLSIYLQPNDNVVLVMLPTEALAGTDMYSIVKRISEGLENRKTIGLAIGNDVIGYSALLPDGVASEQMDSARSVSNDPITALFTFSRNINIWLVQNPQPTATPSPEPTRTPRPTLTPIEIPKTNEVPVSLWIPCLGGFFMVIIWLAIQIKRARDRSKYNSRMSRINQDNY